MSNMPGHLWRPGDAQRGICPPDPGICIAVPSIDEIDLLDLGFVAAEVVALTALREVALVLEYTTEPRQMRDLRILRHLVQGGLFHD